ncbi:MAG TPA: transporter [bacterium]|nr:transporter [bacterium]
MKKLFILFVFVLSASGLFATEGGGGSYPNGSEGFMAGAVPPPGVYYLNYSLYYEADKFCGKSGKSLIPDFKLKVTGDVFRFLYVSKKQFLGGYWGTHILLPVLNMKVRNIAHPMSKQKSTGLGDIVIDPFILSWHSKNLHYAAGLDIAVPVGKYDEDELANIGRNYWTFQPLLGLTYVSDNGFEYSGKFMYDINSKNTDTKYKSGNEFHFDYTVSKKIDNWTLGLGGYYYKQITDDKLNGVKTGDGFKGQAFAVGPQIKYDFKKISFILKYQIESDVKYKPEGDKIWFKLICPL